MFSFLLVSLRKSQQRTFKPVPTYPEAPAHDFRKQIETTYNKAKPDSRTTFKRSTGNSHAPNEDLVSTPRSRFRSTSNSTSRPYTSGLQQRSRYPSSLSNSFSSSPAQNPSTWRRPVEHLRATAPKRISTSSKQQLTGRGGVQSSSDSADDESPTSIPQTTFSASESVSQTGTSPMAQKSSQFERDGAQPGAEDAEFAALADAEAAFDRERVRQTRLTRDATLGEAVSFVRDAIASQRNLHSARTERAAALRHPSGAASGVGEDVPETAEAQLSVLKGLVSEEKLNEYQVSLSVYYCIHVLSLSLSLSSIFLSLSDAD